MPLIQLLCAGCGVGFEKSSSEIKRQQRKNPTREFYCSISCYASHEGKKNLGALLGHGDTWLLVSNNRRDQHSPYRYLLRLARNRKHQSNLDLPFLKKLWEEQAGCCALSGIKMDLPSDTLAWEARARDPWKPSLDRIDNSKGYLKGNVRYVSVIANFARNEFSDEQLLEFCRAVVQHNATGISTPQRPKGPSKAKEVRGLWQVSLVA